MAVGWVRLISAEYGINLNMERYSVRHSFERQIRTYGRVYRRMPVVTGNTYFRTNHPGRCLLQRLIHTIGQFAMRVFVATVKSDSSDATRNSKSEMRGRANFPDRFGELGWLF